MKKTIFRIIIIFVLGFLFHSVYEKFPNFITSLFFPINESIFEHNKIIYLSYLILALIEIVFKKENKNILFASVISCILCILILNITFTPVYLYIMKTNDNMLITLSFYLLSIILSMIAYNKILKKDYSKKLELIAILLYIILFIILSYLTYNPLPYALFYDFNNNIYGIKKSS